MNKYDYIHHKISKDSVICGESIFGVLTQAEGHVVNCPQCLAELKKENDNVQGVK